MNSIFNKKWFIALKGILAILVGYLALRFPSVTAVTLATYFGIFLLVAGIILGVVILRNYRNNAFWWFWLFEAIFDVIVGLIFITNPHLTISILFLFFALWVLLFGAIQLIKFFRLGNRLVNRNFTLFSGLLSAIIGILLIIKPFSGAESLIMILGIYAILYGILSIIALFGKPIQFS